MQQNYSVEIISLEHLSTVFQVALKGTNIIPDYYYYFVLDFIIR